MNNPYQVDRYATQGEEARGVRGALGKVAGMIACVLAAGALFLGTMYVLWKAAGH